MWALVTMGICIGIILLGVGGLLISRIGAPDTTTTVPEDSPSSPASASSNNPKVVPAVVTPNAAPPAPNPLHPVPTHAPTWTERYPLHHAPTWSGDPRTERYNDDY